MSGLAVFIAGLVLVAFLPSLVGRLVEGWTWLYTVRLPPDIRDRRRAEVRSDLWEQARAERDLGYRPESMALHQLVRCVLGIPADLLWRRAQARASRRGVGRQRQPWLVELFPYEAAVWVAVVAGLLTSLAVHVLWQALSWGPLMWVTLGVLVSTLAVVEALLLKRGVYHRLASRLRGGLSRRRD